MMTRESVVKGGEVREVDAGDLKRVWLFMSTLKAGVGVHPDLILEQCESADADPLALFLRTLVINVLLEQGALEAFREAATLRDSVFEKAAVAALSAGIQGFDPDLFIASLGDPHTS